MSTVCVSSAELSTQIEVFFSVYICMSMCVAIIEKCKCMTLLFLH